MIPRRRSSSPSVREKCYDDDDMHVDVDVVVDVDDDVDINNDDGNERDDDSSVIEVPQGEA